MLSGERTYEMRKLWNGVRHAHLFRRVRINKLIMIVIADNLLPWYRFHGLMRMAVRWAPTASTVAFIISNTNLLRFSTDPPYSSVRLFVMSWRNWSGRYPFAPTKREVIPREKP